MSAFNNGNFADSKRVKTDMPEEEQPSLIINQVNLLKLPIRNRYLGPAIFKLPPSKSGHE